MPRYVRVRGELVPDDGTVLEPGQTHCPDCGYQLRPEPASPIRHRRLPKDAQFVYCECGSRFGRSYPGLPWRREQLPGDELELAG